jgi:hypothetical protein
MLARFTLTFVLLLGSGPTVFAGEVLAADAPKADAAKAEPVDTSPITANELAQAKDLLTVLGECFKAGDARRAKSCFTPGTEEGQLRRNAIKRVLDREFAVERYTVFDVLEVQAEERLPIRGHLLVWARLKLSFESKNPKIERTVYRNEYFEFDTLPDGRLALVDSEFFDTLGRKQGLEMMGDFLLTGVLSLAVLSFWVWMGYAAMILRPRKRVWRVLVLALPFLGALIFFFAVYLPGLRAPKTA